MSYDDIRTDTVTVGAGASLSDASERLNDMGRLVAVQTAATWDAAAISFQASIDGTNYFVLMPAGTEYSTAAVTAAAFVPVEPDHFQAARYIKIQSGTSGAAVAQADATIVTLVFRKG